MPRNKAEAKAIADLADAYVFRPTKKQKEWLEFWKTRGAGLTLRQGAVAIGIDPKTFWKWTIQPGFNKWVADSVIEEHGLHFAELEMLGMERFRRGGREGKEYFKTLYPNLGEATGAFKRKLELTGKDGKDLKLMTDEELRSAIREIAKEHG